MVIHNPQPPGRWKLVSSATGPYSLRITGVSRLDFGAKFATVPTTSYENANWQPVQGITTHALIEPSGAEKTGGVMETVSLLDIRGVQLGEYSLSKKSEKLYVAEPFRPPDVREYYLVVKGRTGDGQIYIRQSHNAIINIVPEPPRIKMVHTQPGYLNTKATINCIVKSMMPFNVRWYFGKSRTGLVWQELTLPKPHQPPDSVFYEIERVSDSSEGYYKCHVETNRGSDHGVTFLDVEEQPPVIIGNREMRIPPGGTAVLQCNVTSKVPFELQWKRRASGYGTTSVNSPRIHQQEDGSLEIVRVRPSDESIYMCIAKNIGGQSEHSIRLYVEQVPKITINASPKLEIVGGQAGQPERQRVVYRYGQRITMSCMAEGYPTPFIAWKKDGMSLRRRGRHIKVFGGQLRIYTAGAGDGGIYICDARNKAGYASSSIWLDFVEPPTITADSNYTLVEQNKTFQLVCPTTGHPIPTLRWERDGQALETRNGTKYHQHVSMLTIESIKSEEGGTYRCIAENEAGVASHSTVVEVGSAPQISTSLKTTKPEIGLSLDLYCPTNAFPEPVIKWFKDHQPIDESSPRVTVSASGQRLHVDKMAIFDDGVYACRAVNNFGSDQHEIQVIVSGLEPAIVTVGERNMSVIVGNRLVLPCAGSGKPEPDVYWTNRGRRIDPNVGSNLIIDHVTVEDSGSYSCHAVNSAGEDSATITVDIWTSATVTTTGQIFKILEGDPVQMACDVEGNPRVATEWSHEQDPISAWTNNTAIQYIETPSGLVLPGVSRVAAGVWTCHALNEAGSDSVNHELVVEWAPTSKFNEVTYAIQTATLGETVELKCLVDAKPAAVYTWSHNDELISSRGGEYVIDPVTGTLTIDRVRVKNKFAVNFG